MLERTVCETAVNVSGIHIPIDAFMLERDGLATGTCAQRGLSSNRL